MPSRDVAAVMPGSTSVNLPAGTHAAPAAKLLPAAPPFQPIVSESKHTPASVITVMRVKEDCNILPMRTFRLLAYVSSMMQPSATAEHPRTIGMMEGDTH